MARLSIHLLGSFEATLDGEPVSGFASDKVRALLAYLASESDRPHRRGALVGLLWTDYSETSARTSLRRALANLRTVIADHQATPPFLFISRQTIQLNCSADAWCDVTAFSLALAPASPSPQGMGLLEGAIELYRGDFLEGFSLGDSACFEEWLLLKRERLRRQVLDALHRMAAYHQERGEVSKALPYARRQVDLAPWHEGAQRQLMRLLVLSGQRALAVAQYQACVRVLADELDVQPSEETTRLVEQIRAGELVPVAADGESTARLAPPAPPAPAQQTARRRIMGLTPVVWALGGVVLLAMISVALLYATGRLSGGPALFAPSMSADLLPTRPEGRIVGPCDHTSPSRLCINDAQSHRRLLVTDGLPFAIADGYGWSPTGQQIVFSGTMEPESAPRPDSDLYIIEADGSGFQQITSGPANDVLPSWSPDGQWIAFHRDGALWLVRPNGSSASLLWQARGHNVLKPAWSPDSQWIAVPLIWTGELTSPHEIWIIDREGVAPRLLCAFEYPLTETTVAWDPDGESVAMHLIAPQARTTLLMDADGNGQAQTIDSIPQTWLPSFWPQWGRAK